MIPAITSFFRSLLFDPSAAQRYVALGCYLIGEWLGSGGVIPGTNTVIPIPDAINFSSKGALMKAIALYLGAGAGLPRMIPPATGPPPTTDPPKP